jgi:hypothetical protein
MVNILLKFKVPEEEVSVKIFGVNVELQVLVAESKPTKTKNHGLSNSTRSSF